MRGTKLLTSACVILAGLCGGAFAAPTVRANIAAAPQVPATATRAGTLKIQHASKGTTSVTPKKTSSSAASGESARLASLPITMGTNLKVSKLPNAANASVVADLRSAIDELSAHANEAFQTVQSGLAALGDEVDERVTPLETEVPQIREAANKAVTSDQVTSAITAATETAKAYTDDKVAAVDVSVDMTVEGDEIKYKSGKATTWTKLADKSEFAPILEKDDTNKRITVKYGTNATPTELVKFSEIAGAAGAKPILERDVENQRITVKYSETETPTELVKFSEIAGVTPIVERNDTKQAITVRYNDTDEPTELVTFSEIAGAAGAKPILERDVENQRITVKYSETETPTELVKFSEIAGVTPIVERNDTKQAITVRYNDADEPTELVTFSELKGDQGDPGADACATITSQYTAPTIEDGYATALGYLTITKTDKCGEDVIKDTYTQEDKCELTDITYSDENIDDNTDAFDVYTCKRQGADKTPYFFKKKNGVLGIKLKAINKTLATKAAKSEIHSPQVNINDDGEFCACIKEGGELCIDEPYTDNTAWKCTPLGENLLGACYSFTTDYTPPANPTDDVYATKGAMILHQKANRTTGSCAGAIDKEIEYPDTCVLKTVGVNSTSDSYTDVYTCTRYDNKAEYNWSGAAGSSIFTISKTYVAPTGTAPNYTEPGYVRVVQNGVEIAKQKDQCGSTFTTKTDENNAKVANMTCKVQSLDGVTPVTGWSEGKVYTVGSEQTITEGTVYTYVKFEGTTPGYIKTTLKTATGDKDTDKKYDRCWTKRVDIKNGNESTGKAGLQQTCEVQAFGNDVVNNTDMTPGATYELGATATIDEYTYVYHKTANGKPGYLETQKNGVVFSEVSDSDCWEEVTAATTTNKSGSLKRKCRVQKLPDGTTAPEGYATGTAYEVDGATEKPIPTPSICDTATDKTAVKTMSSEYARSNAKSANTRGATTTSYTLCNGDQKTVKTPDTCVPIADGKGDGEQCPAGQQRMSCTPQDGGETYTICEALPEGSDTLGKKIAEKADSSELTSLSNNVVMKSGDGENSLAKLLEGAKKDGGALSDLAKSSDLDNVVMKSGDGENSLAKLLEGAKKDGGALSDLAKSSDLDDYAKTGDVVMKSGDGNNTLSALIEGVLTNALNPEEGKGNANLKALFVTKDNLEAKLGASATVGGMRGTLCDLTAENANQPEYCQSGH